MSAFIANSVTVATNAQTVTVNQSLDLSQIKQASVLFIENQHPVIVDSGTVPVDGTSTLQLRYPWPNPSINAGKALVIVGMSALIEVIEKAHATGNILVSMREALGRIFTQTEGSISLPISENQTVQVPGYLHILADLETRTAAMESSTSQAITNLSRSHSDVVVSYYDEQVVTKNSDTISVDPNDSAVSEWFTVPTQDNGYYVYVREGTLTKVYTRWGYSYAPGHYEDPQYGSDYSISYFQFVMANDSATSAQINQRIQEQALTLHPYGAWWSGARVYECPVIQIPDLHPYTRLWARFINHNMPDFESQPAQNISEFGGTSSFSVERVVNYPHIRT